MHKKKMAMAFLLFSSSLSASIIQMMVEHEDAHYDKAALYGLNPKVDYFGLETTYDTGTREQMLDIIGAGITREQKIKHELSKVFKINHPYTLLTLYRMDGMSDDGQKFFDLMPRQSNNMKRCIRMEAILTIGQILMHLNNINDWFYIGSWTEIDRRGVVGFYEIGIEGTF